jgi:WD40 repeat protein
VRGTKLGKYDLLEAIGRGAVGVVFRARSPAAPGAPSHDLAIKLVHARNPETLARFEREIRLQGTLGEAEGFVPLVDSGTSPEGPYLVMPLLTGGTLRARLARGPLSIDETVALTSALARALGRAHERGIVHRDLKPENVLFSAAGTPLIADLGLAKHFSQDSPGASQSVQLSVAGTFRGTAGYMPPEQMRDARDSGPPVDVFALGAILHECLAGAPAFEGASMLELVTRVDAGAFTPLAEARPDAPAWLTAIARRALARDPADRFADGAALARALAARGPDASPRPRPLGLALAVLGVAGVALAVLHATLGPGTPAEPVGPAKAVARSLPGEPADPTRGFREGPCWKLVATWGACDWKHADRVTSADLSLDGATALSSGLDGTTRLWDAATGHEVAFLTSGATPSCCALSPGGKEAVVGRADGVVEVWDPTAGTSRVLERHGSAITAVAWSPDGKTILAAGGTLLPAESLTIRHLDAVTGAILHELDPKVGFNNALAFLPDGRRAVSGGNGGWAILWDLASGRELARVGGEGHRVSSVAASADGRLAITADTEGGTATLWDLAHGKRIRTVSRQPWEVVSVALSPDARLALVGSRDALELWDLAKVERPVWRAALDWPESLHFSPDGKRAIAALGDHTVRLIDCATGEDLSSREGFDGSVAALACGGRGVSGLAMSAGAFEFREARAGGAVRRCSTGLSLMNTALAPDGSVALSSRNPSSASTENALWDLVTGAAVWSSSAPEPATALAIARDVKTGLAAGRGGIVYRFSLATGEVDAASGGLYPAGDSVVAIAFRGAANDRWVTAGRTGMVTAMGLEDIGLDASRPRLGRHGQPLTTIASSPDGIHVLSGDARGGVRLWMIGRRGGFDLVPGDGAPITALAFSPDDRLAVAASRNGRVALFGDRTTLLGTIDLATSTDYPTALAVDGPRTLLVGTARGVVRRFQILAK